MSNTQHHIEWKETESRIGPNTTYGYWDGAKVFSIFYGVQPQGKVTKTPYVIKSMLPGFRPDLPNQASIAEAQVFLERMLQRWVAKRGLYFKSHVVVTDAMVQAAVASLDDGHGFKNPAHGEYMRRAIEAALKAREPSAAKVTA